MRGRGGERDDGLSTGATTNAGVSRREHLHNWIPESRVYTANEFSRSEPPTQQHLYHPDTHSAAERDQRRLISSTPEEHLSVEVESKKQPQTSPLGGWKETLLFTRRPAQEQMDGVF